MSPPEVILITEQANANGLSVKVEEQKVAELETVCHASPPRRETTCGSARWQSTHWISWRELHGEDESEMTESPRTSTSTPGEFFWTSASAGEERLPVVVHRACLARAHERDKEWSAGKGPDGPL